tara:strand:- start:69 stop:278 length:210 start_codon:yes stop_codon:yes gene_type:complete
MRHQVLLFVRHTMETSWSLGFLSLILIVIPIIGMQLVHKYGWQHWEPFDNPYKKLKETDEEYSEKTDYK